MKTSLCVEKVDITGIEDFLQLSKIEYNAESTVTQLEHIQWKHLDTPNGPSTAINIKNKGDVVGRVILQPRTICIDEKEVPIAFATDSLVHPNFRRPLSNFFSLMKEIKKIKKFAIVLHTSNENTEGIYHDILKFKCPISLSSYGIPVSLASILKKITGFNTPLYNIINWPFRWLLTMLYALSGFLVRIDISASSPKKEILNDLMRKNGHSKHLEILRNPEFLEWRFKSTPLWKADVLHVYSSSNYLGYIVLRHIKLEGLRFTAIMDFSFQKNISYLKMFFIRMYVIKKAIRYGDDAVYVLLNNTANSAKKFLGFPFIKIPDKILPHKTPFFVHVNNKDYQEMEEYQDLHITLADLDYF